MLPRKSWASRHAVAPQQDGETKLQRPQRNKIRASLYLNFRKKQGLRNPGEIGIRELRAELVHVGSVRRGHPNCEQPEKTRSFTLGKLRKFRGCTFREWSGSVRQDVPSLLFARMTLWDQEDQPRDRGGLE